MPRSSIAISFSIAVYFASTTAIDPARGQMLLPPGFTATDLVSGLSSATSMCVAPNGTIYIAQKSGTMRVWREDSGLFPTQFFANQPLDINTAGERGLIGVTLDPSFESNRFVYVHYTVNSTPRHGRISRFTADPDGNLALPGSEAVLLELDSLSSIYHNGGALHFGPDGKLYVGVGENFVSSNSQSANSLLGKILRINPVPGDVIPSDNPTSFPGVVGTPAGNNRAIWALGLRNPFRFAFQPGTGRMMINDVGDASFEELNEGIAGRNYGWPLTEGAFDPSAYPALTPPFYAYAHGTEFNDGACVTGGVFYNPKATTYPPNFFGDYFFADFQQYGWIRRIDTSTGQASDFALFINSIVDLGLDSQGRLLALGLGKLIRIEYTAPPLQCRTPEIKRMDALDAAAGAGFGAAIAISHETMIVGAPYDDNAGGVDAGAVYVFVRNGDGWIQQAKLTANDGASGNWFGTSVAIFGERALIGASRNSPGNISNAGAAYVFARNGTSWNLEAKLVAPDAAASDSLGSAVAMSEDVALIGASLRDLPGTGNAGATYVFTRSGTVWSHHSTLTAPNASLYDSFGYSLTLQGDTALIGAPGGSTSTGSAYIFVKVADAWIQQARIVAADAPSGAQFGCAVSRSGESLLIGAMGETTSGVMNAGAAYLFTRSAPSWIQSHKFTEPIPSVYSGFGNAVSLSGNRALFGAPYSSRDGEFFKGAAYVFGNSNGEWALEKMLVASDSSHDDYFGDAVTIDDDASLVGSYFDDHAGPIDSGSVYIFTASKVPGDIDQNGQLDMADVAILINVLIGIDTGGSHAICADINCNGLINGVDIQAMVKLLIDG